MTARCSASCLRRSSPDEEALVEFARFMGFELSERKSPMVTLSITLPGEGLPRERGCMRDGRAHKALPAVQHCASTRTSCLLCWISPPSASA